LLYRFNYGHAKDGKPILWIRLIECEKLFALLTKGVSEDAVIDFLFNVISICCEDMQNNMPPGIRSALMIIDATGLSFSFANSFRFVFFFFFFFFLKKYDRKYAGRFTDLTDYYSGLLSTACVINCHWLLRTLWTVAKLFMPPETSAKFFISGDSSAIAEFVPDDMIVPQLYQSGEIDERGLKYKIVDHMRFLKRERSLEKEKKKEPTSDE